MSLYPVLHSFVCGRRANRLPSPLQSEAGHESTCAGQENLVKPV